MTPQTPSHRLQTINDLLLYRLNRLSAQAGAMVVRLCEGGHGITRRQWGVIGMLREQGAMTPSALAERFELDRARTSRMVGALVEKGLITRDVMQGNRRQAQLTLTEAGAQLYDSLMPQVQEINRRILQVLSEEEMAQFDALVRRLHGSVDEVRQSLDAQLPKTHRRLGQRRSQGAS